MAHETKSEVLGVACNSPSLSLRVNITGLLNIEFYNIIELGGGHDRGHWNEKQ